MRGYVTTRHVFTLAPIIVEEFGWRAYLSCLASCLVPHRRPKTFLDIVGRFPPRSR